MRLSPAQTECLLLLAAGQCVESNRTTEALRKRGLVARGDITAEGVAALTGTYRVTYSTIGRNVILKTHEFASGLTIDEAIGAVRAARKVSGAVDVRIVAVRS